MPARVRKPRQESFTWDRAVFALAEQIRQELRSKPGVPPEWDALHELAKLAEQLPASPLKYLCLKEIAAYVYPRRDAAALPVERRALPAPNSREVDLSDFVSRPARAAG
jgi:hypothetical protein